MEILEDQMPLLQEIYMIDKLAIITVYAIPALILLLFVYELLESKFFINGVNFFILSNHDISLYWEL